MCLSGWIILISWLIRGTLGGTPLVRSMIFSLQCCIRLGIISGVSLLLPHGAALCDLTMVPAHCLSLSWLGESSSSIQSLPSFLRRVNWVTLQVDSPWVFGSSAWLHRALPNFGGGFECPTAFIFVSLIADTRFLGTS